MYKFIGLYLLIIIGIFIEFSFLGNFGNALIKIIILISISYFLYEIWNEQVKKHNIPLEPKPSSEYPDTPEIKSKEKQLVFEKQTRLTELFEYNKNYLEFITNQFMIIWDFIYPQNGYIFYQNESGEIQLIHKNIQPEIIVTLEDKPIALFKLIKNKNTILVENHIDNSLHLIPFYKKVDYVPKSILGFVMPLETEEQLFWFFDSDIAENFNLEDLRILQRIIQNTEAMTNEALHIVALSANCHAFNRNFEIANQLNTAKTKKECLEIFCDFIIQNFEASKLTIAIRQDWNLSADNAVIQTAIGLDDPFKEGFQFPINEGLNGWVIMKNKPHLIDDIEQGDYFVPRFSKQEKSNYGLHSYLSVPIPRNGEAIGMITLEEKSIKKYGIEDKKNLMDYANILANSLSRFEDIEIQ